MTSPADKPPDRTVALFDWRAAARNTERACGFTAIDHALTATGLASEIDVLVRRMGRLS